MAESKKYYWLKLKEDFFDDDTIQWIEEQPNGEKYSLFYLKLCLKSLKSDGVLIRNVGDMLIPYDTKKISELTRTDIDTVRVSMELFKKLGLIQILENGEIFLTQLENMVGSESKWAKYKRNKEIKPTETPKQIGDFPTEVQHDSNDCPKKLQTEIEKEIENRDKEIDIQAIELCKYYDELKPGQSITKDITTLKIFLEDYEYDWCKEALQKTVIGTGKFVANYMGKILKDWAANGKPEKKGAKEDGTIKRGDEGDNLREQGIGL